MSAPVAIEDHGIIGNMRIQFGNFPQALTHLSLINSAVSLDAQLEGEPVAEAPQTSG